MAKRIPLPPDFLETLTGILYTAENMQRASEYVASRQLDPSRLRLPWMMTSADRTPFEFVRRWNRFPSEFTESLFIPIVDLRYDPALTGRAVLAGYDIRYCGPRPDRAKYTKIKRDKDTPMLYNAHEALGPVDRPNSWALVVESAICVETLRPLGLPVVGALTAQGAPTFALLLYGLFSRVFVMYDNDRGGRAGTKNLLAGAARAGNAVREAFTPIVFSGKDPNQSMCELGISQLRQSLFSQVPQQESPLLRLALA